VQFQKRKKRTVNLDISPLIDCVFLLLIFYAVSTTFNRKTGEVRLELPASEHQEAGVEARMVVTMGQQDDDLFFNNRPVTPGELRTLLEGELKNPAKKGCHSPGGSTGDARPGGGNHRYD